MRFRGGGHKQSYRIVDFKRRKFDVPATVERLEYDPNRTAFIALISIQDGEQAYIIAPQRLAVGDRWSPASQVDIKPGNAMPLASNPGRHDRPQRRDEDRQGRRDRALRRHLCAARRPGPGLRALQLISGELRMVRGECIATVGAVSNPDHMNQSIGKAGRKRWLGRRPHNRGVAMNPVDHPHGGGEGRTSGGRHPVTPVGQADQGQEDARQQADGQVHRRFAARPQEEGLIAMTRSSGKVRSSTAIC